MVVTLHFYFTFIYFFLFLFTFFYFLLFLFTFFYFFLLLFTIFYFFLFLLHLSTSSCSCLHFSTSSCSNYNFLLLRVLVYNFLLLPVLVYIFLLLPVFVYIFLLLPVSNLLHQFVLSLYFSTPSCSEFDISTLLFLLFTLICHRLFSSTQGKLFVKSNYIGLISEYIRRCHYNESVSVLTDVGTEFDTKVGSSQYLEN